MFRVVTDEPTREPIVPSELDEIVREGARRMLAAALEAEVDAYIEAHAGERDEQGQDVPNDYGWLPTVAMGALVCSYLGGRQEWRASV